MLIKDWFMWQFPRDRKFFDPKKKLFRENLNCKLEFCELSRLPACNSSYKLETFVANPKYATSHGKPSTHWLMPATDNREIMLHINFAG